jgi:hypothetical protein
VFFSVKPSCLYNGSPALVADSSINDRFKLLASSIIYCNTLEANPFLRKSLYVSTLSKVPVLPVMNNGFAGFSAITR